MNIVKTALALGLLACIGTLVYGGATLGTNKARSLALMAGAVIGAIICGASYALVGTTSGATVPTGTILFTVFR